MRNLHKGVARSASHTFFESFSFASLKHLNCSQQIATFYLHFVSLVDYSGDLLPRGIILWLIRFYQYNHK